MFTNLVRHVVHDGDVLPELTAVGYEYLFAGNGVFIQAENRFFRAVVPVVKCAIRGLMPLRAMVQLKIPRLPTQLLEQVLVHAQGAKNQTGKQIETLYRFIYEEGQVQVILPTQTATAVQVSTSDTHDNVVLELHSHGSIRAFWSQTDNADEQGFCFYGVLGALDGRPEMGLRVGVYGHWLSVPITTLFTGTADLRDIFDGE